MSNHIKMVEHGVLRCKLLNLLPTREGNKFPDEFEPGRPSPLVKIESCDIIKEGDNRG